MTTKKETPRLSLGKNSNMWLWLIGILLFPIGLLLLLFMLPFMPAKKSRA